jgi:hypothetical protein
MGYKDEINHNDYIKLICDNWENHKTCTIIGCWNEHTH